MTSLGGEIMREWLRKLRNEKGLTMKDMGEKLGISESYYCAIENGDRQKKMDMMIASGLATIFEISVLSIVTYEEQWKN
ncbi:helix-turn-helix domain-containing protein [Intestinimonas sp. MSJ-38]|nr:helix-turn-helix domain-containing protein [Intestinimonas sp. MSJ-38]